MKEGPGEEVLKLRHELHQNPELSGSEEGTAARIVEHLNRYAPPDRLLEGIGGHGVLAVYEGEEKGATILFRCELDALPIREEASFTHASRNKGVSHKCGHDGHMAIVTGLGQALSNKRPSKGRVILLYQPAEETGEGAERVIDDPAFSEFEPDRVYALHNLPGFPEGHIVSKEGVFASASKGKEVYLYGRTSHAGEPENGISPALAMADIVKEYFSLPQKESFEGFVLLTVIHARLGSIAFGTSPGEAEVRATLRTHREDDLAFLEQKCEEIAIKEARENELAVAFDEKEVFPASRNDKEAVKLVREAAKLAGLEQEQIDTPFRWSEDFGHFLHRWPGALFGLGSGKKQADLHHPDYDFPDGIIGNGIRIFEAVARRETGGET